MHTLAFWQALTVAILGAALTFFGVWWNSRSNFKQLHLKLEHEEKLQRKQLSRERLEELYGLVGQWDGYIFSAVLHLGMLTEGQITEKDYLERYSPTDVETPVDYTRIEMIVGLYGKSFKVAYEEASNKRNFLVALIGEVERTYLEGLPTKQIFSSLMEAHRKFEISTKTLKAEISESVFA